MIRKLAYLSLAAGAIALVEARPVAAAPVSANNPYRSFNIGGVNYGSMRWEQSRRGQLSVGRAGWGHRGGGLLFRRR